MAKFLSTSRGPKLPASIELNLKFDVVADISTHNYDDNTSSQQLEIEYPREEIEATIKNLIVNQLTGELSKIMNPADVTKLFNRNGGGLYITFPTSFVDRYRG